MTKDWSVVLLLVSSLFISSCGTGDSNNSFSKLFFRFAPSSDVPSALSASSPDLASSIAPLLGYNRSYATAPTDTNQFLCLAVNVVGPGIPSSDSLPTDESIDSVLARLYAGSSCSYPGITSPPISLTEGASATLTVPTGPNRIIQVVGFMNPDFCSLTEPVGTSKIESSGDIFELGRAQQDIFGDTTVSIGNSYQTLTTQVERDARRLDCGSSVGAYVELKLRAVFTSVTTSVSTGVSDFLAANPFYQISSFSLLPATTNGGDPGHSAHSIFGFGVHNSDGTFTTSPLLNAAGASFSGGAVVDFVFDRDFDVNENAILASQYNRILVNAMACGSTSSSGGSCSMGTPGVKMSILGNGTWGTIASNSSTTDTDLSLDQVSAGSYYKAYAGTPNGNLIVVSVRSNAIITGNYSYVHIASIKAYLAP